MIFPQSILNVLLKTIKEINKGECHKMEEFFNMQKEIVDLPVNERKNKFNKSLDTIKFKNNFKLYQYKPFSNYICDAIINDYIYMAKPTEFNDPFDVIGHLSKGRLPEKFTAHLVRSHLADQIEEIPEGCTYIHQLSDSFCKKVTNPSGDYLQKYYERLKKLTMDNVKIACFTTRKDNIPMWYHYASNYSGICIEYDLNRPYYKEGKLYLNDQEKTDILLPVNYKDKTNPYLTDPSDIECFIKNISNQKSSDWKYEDEWRLVRYGKDSSSQFTDFSIRSIYVGNKMSEVNLKLLKELVKFKNSSASNKIKIYQMNIGFSGAKLQKEIYIE